MKRHPVAERRRRCRQCQKIAPTREEGEDACLEKSFGLALRPVSTEEKLHAQEVGVVRLLHKAEREVSVKEELGLSLSVLFGVNLVAFVQDLLT